MMKCLSTFIQKKNKMNPTHAGFIVKCGDLYLICHSTQNRNHILTDDCWTITKGKIDAGETPLEAATRELIEETGYVISKNDDISIPSINTFTVGSYKGHHKKTVEVFQLNLPESYLDFTFCCDSLIDNEKHYLYGYPEMDAFMRAKKEIARELVFSSQKCLFE